MAARRARATEMQQGEVRVYHERRWQPVECDGAVFSPRTGHTVVKTGDCLYLFGGTDHHQRQQDLFRFKPSEGHWEAVATKGTRPSRRSGALAGEIDGKIYLFGGYDGRDGNYFNDVHCLDLNTFEWRRVDRGSNPQYEAQYYKSGGRPAPRTDHCVATYKGLLLVFGGYNGRERFNDVWGFDPSDNIWLELAENEDWDMTIPTRRFGHTGVVHNDLFWIFGGWDGHDTLSCIWAFDLCSFTWFSWNNLHEIRSRAMKLAKRYREEVKDQEGIKPFAMLERKVEGRIRPIKREPGPSGEPFLDEMYCSDFSDESDEEAMVVRGIYKVDKRRKKVKVGVSYAKHYFAKHYDCDPKESEFKHLTVDELEVLNRPLARYRHSAVVHGHHMYIFGGVNRVHTRFNTLHAFDFRTLRWNSDVIRGDSPTPRTFHRAAALDSHMYIIGGYDGDLRLNDMHRIYLGPLTPNSLTEQVSAYIRFRAEQLQYSGELDIVPQYLRDNLIFMRDHHGVLRGGRFDHFNELCRRLTLAKNGEGEPYCSTCFGNVEDHDIVDEKTYRTISKTDREFSRYSLAAQKRSRLDSFGTSKETRRHSSSVDCVNCGSGRLSRKDARSACDCRLAPQAEPGVARDADPYDHHANASVCLDSRVLPDPRNLLRHFKGRRALPPRDRQGPSSSSSTDTPLEASAPGACHLGPAA